MQPLDRAVIVTRTTSSQFTRAQMLTEHQSGESKIQAETIEVIDKVAECAKSGEPSQSLRNVLCAVQHSRVVVFVIELLRHFNCRPLHC